MTKGFKWNKFVTTTTQEVLNNAMINYIVYGGNFAKDKNGNSITRTDEEMENIDND